jgi:hypothetical protein
MSENLSQMVKEQIPPETVLNEDELEAAEKVDKIVEEQKVEETGINIVPLSEWFESNYKNFDNINAVKVSIKGVNSDANLLMTVKTPGEESDEEGGPARELFLFKDANIQPVLNIPGMDMQIYNNGFKIVYDYNQDNIYIKGYGVRTGLIISFCNNIDGNLVPYVITKVRKKDSIIDLIAKDPNEVRQKLLEKADIEALELRYSQISKAEAIETNYDAISWLLARQAEVTDINHHLQIDNVIIATLE